MAKKSIAGKNSNSSDDKLTDKSRCSKGQVLARIVIEVLGAPKEYVEEAIQLVVDKIQNTPGFEVVSESTYEAKEAGKLFSTFSEVEIWFKNIDALSGFIFEFTPSSVEILQPQELSLDARFMSGFFNDFLLKMHDLGMKLKDNSANIELLKKNTDVLIRNFIHHSLTEPRCAEDIGKITGIPKQNAEALLSNFEKAGIVKRQGEKFFLVKKVK